MKHSLLIFLGTLAAVAATAQTNLALNQPAYASTVSDENAAFTADKAVDGTTGTKWASNYDTKHVLGTDYDAAAQWLYVDLGSAQDVNTVKISWDNQAAHKFDIRYATDDPSAAPSTAGQVALADLAGTDNAQNVFRFSEAVTARYLIIDLKEKGPWGYGITELEVYNIDYENAAITTIQVSPTFFMTGTETTFTLTAIDNFNNVMDGVAYTLGDAAMPASYTATTEGPIAITGTDAKGNTTTTNVYALSSAPQRTDTADDIEILQSGKSTSGQGTAWEGGYTALPDFVYADGTKSYHAANVETLYLTNPGLSADELAGFQKLHLDVLSSVDCANAQIVLEGIGTQWSFAVKAGEWTAVEVPFTGGNAATSWIKIKFGDTHPEVLIDNVYFSKEEAHIPFAITVADGVAKVSGDVSLDDVDAINAADALWIDLTSVTSLAKGVAAKISPLRQNALVRVAGTIEDNLAVVDPAVAQLATVRNAVVATNWIFPLAQLQFTDADDEPLWDGEGGVNTFLSTGSRGYRIVRALAKDQLVSAAPAAATPLPAGVEAFELGAATSKAVTLSKILAEDITLAAKTPYLLRASKSALLVTEGTGDLNLRDGAQTVTVGSATFTANLTAAEGTGKLLAAADGSAFVAADAEVGALRAYFTGVTESTRFVLNDGIDREAPFISYVTNKPAETSADIITLITDNFEETLTVNFIMGDDVRSTTAKGGEQVVFTVDGLQPDTYYSVRVEAVDAAGNKSLGRTTFFRTLPKAQPGEDDPLTAISAVGTDEANAPVYNLQGQRTAPQRTGVYVVGGRKVVVRK